MQIKIAAEYNRQRCIAQTRSCLRRWIPPTPGARPVDAADCVEAALKDVLPGYHVRVEVTRIATGNGTGN